MCPHRFLLDRDLETIECYMLIGETLGFVMTDMLLVGVTIPVNETLRHEEEEDLDITEELDMFYDYVVDQSDSDTDDDDESIIDLTLDD